MSQHLINQYLNDLDRLKKVSGVLNEMTVREAFKDMLKSWARQADLVFAAELEFRTKFKTAVNPDGTILHSIRVPLGYWEAKDTKDDLDEEIAKKTAKGYPQSNIIYENGHTAVLIQNRQEVMRCDMTEPQSLLRLVTLFFGYEREEIAEFRRAVEQFKADLPAVLDALREQIDQAYAANEPFQQAAQKFLKHAKDTINPAVTEADVREMLIQHILTEEIFAHVFDQSDFHRENNIAKELYALEARFFTGAAKRNTLKALEPYYASIRANAAAISSHAEKQSFLKAIYENFYKVYNPKAADRLGVVYTPNEIVRFMIEGADWLCKKHFGKHLIDPGVEILDPATGTGTFICELLEHFRGQPDKLQHKYKNELHANEVAILPYYVANLNIEATYAAITGQFAEFPNLCFVDTLDNVAGLGIRAGHQHDLFASFSDENVERVKRQNRRKISVIIGNPPYNANQQNENDNNKNREYTRIDQRIRDTYIKKSAARKTKQYDMFVRFIRWSSDRIHDEGVLSFIVNRKFVDGTNFDGFRKTVAQEFQQIFVVDLGGDYKTKGVGSGGNVFGIGTGVAILLLVKVRKKSPEDVQLKYICPPVKEAYEKLSWINTVSASKLPFETLQPDPMGYWLDIPTENTSGLLALVPGRKKSQIRSSNERAIFQLSSLGLVTGRDDWIFDRNRETAVMKQQLFTSLYNQRLKDGGEEFDIRLKWTRSLKRRFKARQQLKEKCELGEAQFRPFSLRLMNIDWALIEMPYRNREIYQDSNRSILVSQGKRGNFSVHATSRIPSYDYFLPDACVSIPLWRYSKDDGTRIDNITNWVLKQFQTHYEKGETKLRRRITKNDIFHYVYGVLHDPVYRETYAINLKREFPRIPLYPDFWRWAEWGERLMALHIGYEAVEPWPLVRQDMPESEAVPITKLKADKDNGTIILDTRTTLSGIPAIAWTYRLGNRSALEWVLDQHKEKKPKDPTIAAKFNTYRFKDYKEKVVDLLARVTRVSVETMEIIGQMADARRD